MGQEAVSLFLGPKGRLESFPASLGQLEIATTNDIDVRFQRRAGLAALVGGGTALAPAAEVANFRDLEGRFQGMWRIDGMGWGPIRPITSNMCPLARAWSGQKGLGAAVMARRPRVPRCAAAHLGSLGTRTPPPAPVARLPRPTRHLPPSLRTVWHLSSRKQPPFVRGGERRAAFPADAGPSGP